MTTNPDNYSLNLGGVISSAFAESLFYKLKVGNYFYTVAELSISC
jgi:hypothetical protein